MTNKKLTVKDILEKKKLIEEKANKNFYSKLFDAEIEVKDAKADAITEILSDSSEGEYRRYLKLIYLCCPLFKDEELRGQFTDIKEPYDIINKVFGNNINEVMQLGNFILSKYGFLDEGLLDKVKKQ